MDDNAVELNICVTKDDAGYGFSITGVTTFEVSKIAENGAAEHAGLRVSDVIRKINGQPPTGSPKVVHHMITGALHSFQLAMTRGKVTPVHPCIFVL